MLPDSHRRYQVVFVVLLVCLTILAQSFALAAESQPKNDFGSYCPLCHIGPAPLLRSTVTAAVAPTWSVVWLAPAASTQIAPEIVLPTRTSRAPPV